MNARKVREDLGRAKACCARRDTERALFLTISALKELGGQSAPLDLRGDFRAAVAERKYLVGFPCHCRLRRNAEQTRADGIGARA